MSLLSYLANIIYKMPTVNMNYSLKENKGV